MKTIALSLILFLLPVIGFAQTAEDALSDDAVLAALATGARVNGAHTGLVLRDSGKVGLDILSMATNAFAATQGVYAGAPRATRGFWIEAWTPLGVVQQYASNAAKQFKVPTLSDVPTDLRAPVFRVIIHPDTPGEVTAAGAVHAAGAEHVVLRSADKRTVIQPLSVKPFTETVSNALGGVATYGGVIATFSLAGLDRVHHDDGKLSEFYITIVRDNSTKPRDFVVQEKHFKRLPFTLPSVSTVWVAAPPPTSVPAAESEPVPPAAAPARPAAPKPESFSGGYWLPMGTVKK